MGMVAITYKVMPDSEIEDVSIDDIVSNVQGFKSDVYDCLLYTSPSPRDS